MSTWLEFKTNVKDLLPGDSPRDGLDTYVDKIINQGVINLQSDIAVYRKGHETVYSTVDVITDGSASLGTLPDQAEPRDAFYVKIGESCIRQPFQKFDWGNRFDLICGKVCLNGCQYAIAFDPYGSQFYAYPAIVDGRKISLFWDGRKLEFADGDTVPFDEGAALAVSLFASAHIARKTNHELSEYNSYMADFITTKRKLYLDALDRTRFKETTPSDAASEPCPPVCSPCVTCGTPVINPADVCCEQIKYYDLDPNAEGVVPDDKTKGAIAYQKDGTGPTVTWNVMLQVWQ